MNSPLKKFNDTIDLWISFLDNYTYDSLIMKPQPGSWSLGQVYAHLISDTSYHVGQMKAALETRSNHSKQMHHDAKAMFDNNSFPDLQIVGPGTDDNTPQPTDKESVKRQLTEIRFEVNELDRLYDVPGSTGKSRHPGLNYFSATEWLIFTEMHMRHHLKQKARIDAFLSTI